jgi:hypothetical protein
MAGQVGKVVIMTPKIQLDHTMLAGFPWPVKRKARKAWKRWKFRLQQGIKKRERQMALP